MALGNDTVIYVSPKINGKCHLARCVMNVFELVFLQPGLEKSLPRLTNPLILDMIFKTRALFTTFILQCPA